MNERQELLTTLMESKYRPQKDAPGELLELLGQKHRLGKLKKEMERAQMLEERELLVVESAFTVATSSSSFRSFSPSVAPGVDEEMLMPSLESERDWWNADLEGGKEKLAVEGAFFRCRKWIQESRRED